MLNIRKELIVKHNMSLEMMNGHYFFAYVIWFLEMKSMKRNRLNDSDNRLALNLWKKLSQSFNWLSESRYLDENVQSCVEVFCLSQPARTDLMNLDRANASNVVKIWGLLDFYVDSKAISLYFFLKEVCLYFLNVILLYLFTKFFDMGKG